MPKAHHLIINKISCTVLTWHIKKEIVKEAISMLVAKCPLESFTNILCYQYCISDLAHCMNLHKKCHHPQNCMSTYYHVIPICISNSKSLTTLKSQWVLAGSMDEDSNSRLKKSIYNSGYRRPIQLPSGCWKKSSEYKDHLHHGIWGWYLQPCKFYTIS